MTESDLRALIPPMLREAKAMGVAEAVAAFKLVTPHLAPPPSRPRHFSEDEDDDSPEPEPGGFTAADIPDMHRYFRPADDGSYPADFHKTFGCTAREFARASGLVRKPVDGQPDGRTASAWRWVKREGPTRDFAEGDPAPEPTSGQAASFPGETLPVKYQSVYQSNSRLRKNADHATLSDALEGIKDTSSSLQPNVLAVYPDKSKRAVYTPWRQVIGSTGAYQWIHNSRGDGRPNPLGGHAAAAHFTNHRRVMDQLVRTAQLLHFPVKEPGGADMLTPEDKTHLPEVHALLKSGIDRLDPTAFLAAADLMDERGFSPFFGETVRRHMEELNRNLDQTGRPETFADPAPKGEPGAGSEQLGHMLAAFQGADHIHNRAGGEGADHLVRGQLADALQDNGRDAEGALLRDPDRHVMVHEGRVVPARYTLGPLFNAEHSLSQHLRRLGGSAPDYNFGWEFAPSGPQRGRRGVDIQRRGAVILDTPADPDSRRMHISELPTALAAHLEDNHHAGNWGFQLRLAAVRNAPFEEPLPAEPPAPPRHFAEVPADPRLAGLDALPDSALARVADALSENLADRGALDALLSRVRTGGRAFADPPLVREPRTQALPAGTPPENRSAWTNPHAPAVREIESLEGTSPEVMRYERKSPPLTLPFFGGTIWANVGHKIYPSGDTLPAVNLFTRRNGKLLGDHTDEKTARRIADLLPDADRDRLHQFLDTHLGSLRAADDYRERRPRAFADGAPDPTPARSPGDTSTSATHEGLPRMLAAISPGAWRGHAHHDLLPRLAAADYAQDLGHDREAGLLRDTSKHLFRTENNGIQDAGELSRDFHAHGLRSIMHLDSRDPFVAGYLRTALWASHDPDAGEPLDEDHGLQDIHPDTLAAMIADAHNFRYENEGDMHFNEPDGHNLWLSRNGHGAGFFDDTDRYGEEVAQRLQDAARRHGEYDLHIGPDGLIHGSYGVAPAPPPATFADRSPPPAPNLREALATRPPAESASPEVAADQKRTAAGAVDWAATAALRARPASKATRYAAGFRDVARRRRVLAGIKSEKELADGIGGHHLPDSEPADVIYLHDPLGKPVTDPAQVKHALSVRATAVERLRDPALPPGQKAFLEQILATPAHAFEVKSLLSSPRNYVQISPRALAAKKAWSEKHAVAMHLVALDRRRGAKYSGNRVYVAPNTVAPTTGLASMIRGGSMADVLSAVRGKPMETPKTFATGSGGAPLPERRSSANLAALLKQARSDPYTEAGHGVIADALDEEHPGNHVSGLVRAQFGLGEHGGEGAKNNLWHEPVENSWDGTFPYAARLGRHGPFNLFLRHEGTEEHQGENQRWIVHAVSTLPGSKDFGYNFEFPHEQAHLIPQMFPTAGPHISSGEFMPNGDYVVNGKIKSSGPPHRNQQYRNTEAREFEERMDQEERDRP